MEWVTLAVAVIGLVVLFIKEFFSAKARKRELDKAFQKAQEEMKKLMEESLIKLRESLKKDKSDVDAVDDQLDRKP